MLDNLGLLAGVVSATCFACLFAEWYAEKLWPWVKRVYRRINGSRERV